MWIWYCRNRVPSCSITYVVQQDTQLLLWLNIYSQYVWQLDMFRTYRSILRSIYKLCCWFWYVKTVCCSVRPYVRWLFHITYGRTEQHTIFTYQNQQHVWTHRATHNLHIPNQQHAVYRGSWGWTCRSETCRGVKNTMNKYSTIKKVVYLVETHI